MWKGDEINLETEHTKLDRCSQNVRRFARSLGAQDANSVGQVWQQSHAQIDWNVLGSRRLVIPSAIVDHTPRVGIEDGLLSEEESDALDKRTLNLTDVNNRIERLTAVVHNVGAQHVGVTAEYIHLNLSAGSTPHIVSEWVQIGLG